MEDNIILENKRAKSKNRNRTLCRLFRALGVVTLLAGIALGIWLGFEKVSTFNYYSQTFVTKTVFELWRAFIFWFTGLCSALCFFAVSTVFDKK